jgi:hypothetical protein
VQFFAPPPQSDSVVPKALPPVLHLQLDNACSDNKNRYTFCFFSLLVANGVFREVYVNFMLVGHTHEDIDALFGRWSMRLRKHDYPTVPLLMKSFMDGESIPVVPHLIQEVPDFKGFIDPCICKKGEALEGHTTAQAFKFYRNPNGWPLMQYKRYCTDAEWLPKEGGGIRLWREDNEGKPILPSGEPNALAPQQMRNHSEITKGIGGFINLWETVSAEDITGEYRRTHEHLIQYWRRVKLALAQDPVVSRTLRNGFWPKTRISPSAEDKFMDHGELREEFGVDAPFVGRRRDRPAPSFRVGRDVYAGYFVVLRPSDGDKRPFWIARALTNVDAEPVEHPQCILIQYWKPSSSSNHIQETYAGWDGDRSMQWTIEDSQPPVWEHTNSMMSAWKSGIRDGTRNPTMRIPSLQVNVIKESLAVFDP